MYDKQEGISVSGSHVSQKCIQHNVILAVDPLISLQP